MVDSYFGAPSTDWTTAYKAVNDKEQKSADETMKRAAASRAADSKPSLPLEKYVGEYSDPWYGKITIRQESTGLVIALDRTHKGVGDLQHWQYDTFKAHWRDHTVEDAFVTFTLKPDGSIDHFTMAAVSPLADFSFDYQDLYLTPVAKQPQKK
jgi:hypothetical protein